MILSVRNLTRTAFTVLFLFALFALPVSAQSPTAQANTRVNAEERVAEREASREARRVALTEQGMARIREFLARVNTRFQAAINRLANLIERIEARLVKFSEENPDVDLSQIEADLGEAKTLLAETEAEFEELKASLPGMVEEMFESDNPREFFMQIKEAYSGIRTNLVEVHTMLAHIIGDIKGLRIGNTQ